MLGRATSEIVDGDAWLASLDRFGIVSPRAVLLDGATVAQNLAMPFTLEIDPVPPDTAARVAALARECGIDDVDCRRPAEVPAAIRARVHVARAVALEPALLMLEHPTLGIAQRERAARWPRTSRRCSNARAAGGPDHHAGRHLRDRVAHRALRLEPATGALKPIRSANERSE